jgi:tetratricopeptide (TPR) repeat protein
MKYFFCTLSLLFFLFSASAQPLLKMDVPALSGGNSYAIVIGISDYKYPDIPKLNFSNRDAVVFADFLMSESGGSVPKHNIRLLTDSMASIGNVDKAIRWVMNNCRENDKVYFYFSGHGEMENVTMSKNGYLICYNTPAVAITNMGLSIDYLNDIVNTLSVQTKAKVIVITDACHSGTMNGNKFKGNFFVGEQLMLKKENEIRMASSKPDQLSNEKEDWGGGRGVFSYYLVNGLQGGLADADHDGIVSVGELKTYLENKMANDVVLKNEGDIQTPVISGSSNFQLATVVASESKKIKEQVKNDSMGIVMMMSAMLAADEDAEPADYFFNQLKKQRLEHLTDSLKNNKLLYDDEIAFALMNLLKKDSLPEPGLRKINELETTLKTDKEQLNRFNLDLASSFLDIGQAVIANYIQGDEAELERRRYYNSNNNGYDVYTRMFAVALKLAQADKYYSTKAEVFLHYFSGLALRLKIPLTENADSLIELALIEQNKALNLEEHAAYIYNELGVLYQLKKNLEEAEKYFIRASQLSPRWAIPQSNLSGLYIARKDYEKALDFADKADSLQKNLQSISINRGFVNEKKGNLLFAEEYYHNAIEINSRHYLPFERLGFVNMNTANYAIADSFFYEADLRKKGYHFKANDLLPNSFVEEFGQIVRVHCNIDSAILSPTDIFAFFTWGVQEYEIKNYANAVRILKKVIALDKTNPLVFHYLGKIYYDQQKWEEAEIMFKLAIQYAKKSETFKKYVDSVKKAQTFKYDHACFEDFFYKKYYTITEDYYFAGTVYERWNHLLEAEIYFKKIIKLYPAYEFGAYLKLWQLLERQGRFSETEEVIKSYGKIDKFSSETAAFELNAFYRRSIEKSPEDGNLIYRLGAFLYDRAFLNAMVPYFDTIVQFPLLKKELFIDFDIYAKLRTEDSLTLYDKSETGAFDKVKLEVFSRGAGSTYIIPGTNDTIILASPIYMPRKDGIAYLKRAAELVSDKEVLTDINFKIGNIYLIAGSKKQAYPYLEKSLSFDSGNVNTRLQLIDIYAALYKNRGALKQLDYLYDSSQINFEKRLLLAQFDIRAAQFDKANELLNKAEYIYPYVLPEIANLRGLLNMLAGKTAEAIAFYKKNIDVKKKDLWFTNYSLARLYAITDNKTEAWKYLQKAINAGFNFSFVLQNDSFLENLRNTPQWQSTISSIAMKKYKKVSP